MNGALEQAWLLIYDELPLASANGLSNTINSGFSPKMKD